jgi:alpha-galactosidase
MTNDEALRTGRFASTKKEKYERINDRMLNGLMDFETATKEITGRAGSKQELRAFSKEEIIVTNRLNFEQIADDILKPYRRHWEALDATTHTEQGSVPDHRTRLAAAKMILQLMGQDPNAGNKLTLENNTNINFGVDKLYAMVASFTNEEAQLTAYNEMMRAEQLGYIKPAIASPEEE